MRRDSLYITLLIISLSVFSQALHSQAKGSFEVIHVASVSSGSDDIAPVMMSDGILFCSNRKTNPFLTKKNLEGVRLYDLYFAPFNPEGNLSKPVRFAPNLGKDANIGPASFSADGNTLYFTRNYMSGKNLKKGQANKLGIFTARRNGSQWTDIQPFEYNIQTSNFSFPFVSADGRYLFFCSDMPGGFGSYDIYMCENIDGRWSTPVNLGSNVNSSYAEIHPFLHSTGRLYFASDRPGGMGGLDIMFSTLSFGVWSKPVWLDEPINSAADDFAFFAVQGGFEGYFASNRRKYNDDIYRFASTIIRWSVCDTLQQNSYCYEFIEETALKLDSVDVKSRWEWNFGDGSKAAGIITQHCYDGPGVYDVSLDIVNLITGRVEKRQASYELEVADIEQPVITAPDTIKAGETIILNARETNLPGMKIARYYWNFGDETDSEGVEVKKVYPIPGKYNIQLIVTSEKGTGGVVREVCVCRNIEVTGNGN
jgi:hypothetical protein